MPKNMLEDIKPLSRKPGKTGSQQPRETRYVAPLPRELPFEPVEPARTSRYGMWYIAGALIVAFLFSLSYLFEHATITVTPKSIPVAFDTTDTFTAQKDSTDPAAIVYTVMTLEGDESVKLPSTQSKQESKFATGRVLLYNAYSPAPYKLIKTTRLATPDGRIYRLDSGVAIPGYTKSSDGVTPGSVEVSVTADTPGDAENLTASDFTLPGLANSPQGTKIYGRSKGAITGGVSGLVYSIPQDAANAALGSLQNKLKSSLTAKAKVQVPDGYVFFDGATVFTTDDSVQVPYSTTADVPLALHGSLTAYLIKEDTLVSAIATQAISQYGGEAVTIPKLSSLALAPAGVVSPSTDTSFPFTLNGQASLVWTVNPDDIKAMLAGKKKSEFQSDLASMVGVERADVVIKPFWKRSFPADVSRISVTIEQP